MLKGIIGKKSKKVKNTVEAGAVKNFAFSIGDPSPLYIDEVTGKKSRYKRRIAPPTFPFTLDYGVIPELHLPTKGLIHGEQSFHYYRPLFVGEEIFCHFEIKDYYEKFGNNGSMGFLVTKRYGEDLNRDLIYTDEQILILNEVVRKGLIL
ncbi:MaoC family dehydratase N-terminal domain-containing protein [Psychrobacillus soli]|uniref:MaoC family dehydratase n=1 Tax=Psychrobacillus soli TaxID=1543965 RepID=A0A544STM1_9BACI|nr:MaoC family dehydratase N-terminal domain-containing protein [Psychrobacillus soli]TQR08560.1 MaoC family dehydratase [Psychrobacillus soli]